MTERHTPHPFFLDFNELYARKTLKKVVYFVEANLDSLVGIFFDIQEDLKTGVLSPEKALEKYVQDVLQPLTHLLREVEQKVGSFTHNLNKMEIEIKQVFSDIWIISQQMQLSFTVVQDLVDPMV